jgi:GNAT superfamily N-acetyltransferase
VGALRDWREAPISRDHDRSSFDCGVEALNSFLKRYARQSHEQGGAKTFVALQPDDPARIIGYYSISPASLAFQTVPHQLTRGLGRYEVPVFRLGRLAVDRSFRGIGMGSALLGAAARRALLVSGEVGGLALTIDAKDADVARWYERFGAVPLLDDPLKLILPLSVVARALEKGG